MYRLLLTILILAEPHQLLLVTQEPDTESGVVGVITLEDLMEEIIGEESEW